MQNSGTLYIVATPIGNLEDLSPRAREILEQADLVAAEDTRHTGRLLSHFGIKTRQMALHDYNEADIVPQLIERLRRGGSIALVSDAGTPLISDPGFRLLRAAHEHAITISPVPGPSAVTTALSVAGLPTDRFCFEGFLPTKPLARRDRMRQLQGETRTLVLFESVHRIKACIADICEIFGESRNAFVGRELSKLHEQCVRRTVGELRQMLEDGSIPEKGEFVVLLEGAAHAESDQVKVDIIQLLVELSAAVSAKQAVAIASRLTGRRKNELYRLMLDATQPDRD